MKRFLYAAMLLLGLSILCSCNKENNNGGSGTILGEWKSTKYEYIFQGSVVDSGNYDDERLEFYDNGNMTYIDMYGSPLTLSYTYDNKLGILNFGAKQWGITISSNTMVLTETSEMQWGDEEYKAIMYKGTQIYSDEDCSKYAPIGSHFWYYKDSVKIPLYSIEGERGELSTYDFYDESKLYFSRVK